MSTTKVNIKEKRFKSVAARRVQKVIESMDSLAKCANKNNYEYSEAEIQKMFKVIKEHFRYLENSYADKSDSKPKMFEF
jgi:aspartate carbamoyltransferase regulatory subunit